MIVIISSVFPPEPVVSALISRDIADSIAPHIKLSVLTPRPSRPMGSHYGEQHSDSKTYEHLIMDSYVCPRSVMVGRMRESLSFGMHANRYLRKHKEQIQCIYLHSWPLPGQFLVVRTARKLGIPIVTHVVDIYPEALLSRLPLLKNIFIRLLLPIDSYALQHSTRVVTISPYMRNYLIRSRNLLPDRIDVIYNWQLDQLFEDYQERQPPKSDATVVTFMFLGNLSKSAALENLILAFHQAGLENCRLVLAGNGSEKQNMINIVNINKIKNIEFWDADMNQVPEIQDKADFLILGLRKGASQFALPSKLPAYMFSAKPIIACVEEDSDTALAIRNADCGWIVEPENPRALAAAFSRAVQQEPSISAAKGKNGRAYARSHFSRKANLEKFVELIIQTAHETRL
jgi:glycosyltransferase involved in cell wall biosynthesis